MGPSNYSTFQTIDRRYENHPSHPYNQQQEMYEVYPNQNNQSQFLIRNHLTSQIVSQQEHRVHTQQNNNLTIINRNGPFNLQDRPNIQAVFNGVNLSYPNLQRIHHLGSNSFHPDGVSSDPPMFAVPNFLTKNECDFLIQSASNQFTVAPVVGPGEGMVSSSRTSSTCYLAREDLPVLMKKVCTLVNKPVQHCELPQVGKYLPTQQYLQHYDAFDLSSPDGRRFAANGGQRVVTVLIYLNTPQSGGHTRFPSLFVKDTNSTNLIPLEIKPQQGMAIVFFPATVDGLLDKRALHAALPAGDTKYVSQIWIRQSDYRGQPSTRLSHIMDESINYNFGQCI